MRRMRLAPCLHLCCILMFPKSCFHWWLRLDLGSARLEQRDEWDGSSFPRCRSAELWQGQRHFTGEMKRYSGHLMPRLSECAYSGGHLLWMIGIPVSVKGICSFWALGAEKHREFHVERTLGLLGGPGAGAWQHGKGMGQVFCVARFHLGLQLGDFFSPVFHSTWNV